MNFVFIILGVILILILYGIYTFVFPSKTAVTNANYLLNGVKQVPFTNLENPTSTKYSIELWIYANEVKQASASHAVSGIAGNPSGCIFEVQTNANSVYRLDLFNNADLCFYNTGSNIPTIIMNNFPLQKWCHVVISVNKNLVDMYLDGKLIKSIKTRNSGNYPIGESAIHFGRGNIYISGMNRITSTTDMNTALNKYLNGNAGLKMTNYGISLSLFKENKEQKRFDLI
jgi:hypothetical protein